MKTFDSWWDGLSEDAVHDLTAKEAAALAWGAALAAAREAILIAKIEDMGAATELNTACPICHLEDGRHMGRCPRNELNV